MVNYGRESRIGFDIRKKGKNIKAEGFVKKMKNKYEKAKAALVKSQKEMKKQADRNRKEAEEYRVEDKVLISTKDFSIELMKKATKKLMEKYIESYVVKKIISENTVELELLVLLRIYSVVNVRRIVKYQEQIEGQKKIPPPSIEVASKKEYEVEKIGKTEVFSKIEGVYSRRRYLEGIKKFGECKGLSRRIQEGNKRRRSKISRKEKRKAEDDRGGVEFRSRGVQKE